MPSACRACRAGRLLTVAWLLANALTLGACSLSSGDTHIEPGADGGVCGLRFDPGPCEAAFRVWAFVPELGTCARHIYGGCDGNANRFQTQQECTAACSVDVCPADRVLREVCLECGVTGGCATTAEACALPCGAIADCPSTSTVPLTCVDGACQVGGCI